MSDVLAEAVAAPNPTGGTPLQIMKSRRNMVKNAMDVLLAGASGENRDLHASEQRSFDKARIHIIECDLRIAELQDEEQRAALSAETRRLVPTQEGSGWSVGSEPDVYRDPYKDPSGPSFFRDMARARVGDMNAMERLQRSQQGKTIERRALGNTGAVGGSGGELSPPGWLVDQWVAYARPGRVFADLAHREQLPDNVSSITIPRIATGTTVAIQTTQNSALSQTDLTTNSVTANIVTLGGKQVVSQQLLDQAAVPVDRLVLADLASDYAKQLGGQYIAGSGAAGQLRGVINGAGAVTVAYTSAAPKVVDGTTPANSFLNAVVRAKVAINTTRFMPATAIVMHPRRWGWVQEALDGNGRPLITPEDANGDLNQPGVDGANVAAGRVGTLANLPVYIDPNVPVSLGAGTNEDRVFVCRVEDLFFYETVPQMEAFREPFADSLGVLFRCFAYSASVPDRYGPSVQIIAGTGLVGPAL